MRVVVNPAGGVVDADGLEHFQGTFEGVGLGDVFVDHQGLDELLADPQVGI